MIPLNLGNSLSFFINQGPVFWAATVSVGLGGALLISASFIYLRRFLSNHPLKVSMPQLRRSEKADISPKPEIIVTESGYTVAQAPVADKLISSAMDIELQELQRRIKAAGDSLEGIFSSVENTETPLSPLKPRRAPVEYTLGVG